MDARLKELLDMYIEDFQAGRLNCAEAVLITMCNYYDVDMNVCPMIATAFGGGLCGTQGVCGALSGALMVIGIRHGRELGGDRTRAYELGKRLMAWFRERNGSLNCGELTDTDMTDPEQMKAFRAPGGKHETLCQALVRDTCAWLAEQL